MQFPLLDPLVAIPAMAAVTQTLGFGVTASVTYEQPYLLARTLSTLDHFTDGRVAWNIVTSYQDSAARNLGMQGQIPHDERYDRADEYMEVMYKLFEGSIEPGAVRADAEANVFVDPAKVHDIEHSGAFFSVPGQALTAPGPQRTPLLFQAGSSSRGQQFALDHAEAIFLSGGTTKLVRRWVDGIRDGLEERGRPRDAVKIFTLATIVVADTDEEAQQRFDEYREHVDTESALALFGGWTGVDLAGAEPDAPLEYVADRCEPVRARLVHHPVRREDLDRAGPRRVRRDRRPRTGHRRVARHRRRRTGALDAGDRHRRLQRVRRRASGGPRAVRPLSSPRSCAGRGLLAEGEAGQTVRDRILGSGPWLADDHTGASHRVSP